MSRSPAEIRALYRSFAKTTYKNIFPRDLSRPSTPSSTPSSEPIASASQKLAAPKGTGGPRAAPPSAAAPISALKPSTSPSASKVSPAVRKFQETSRRFFKAPVAQLDNANSASIRSLSGGVDGLDAEERAVLAKDYVFLLEQTKLYKELLIAYGYFSEIEDRERIKVNAARHGMILPSFVDEK